MKLCLRIGLIAWCVIGQGPLTATAQTDTTWWSKAIVYEITPYLFTDHGQFADIEAKLPELVALGINTIWLQPVFQTYAGGQGYDIVDYTHIRTDLGSEAMLASLINTAHQLGIKVILDFVANHTSIHHPFAMDRIAKGNASLYYDYYQSENDHAPYSSNYHKSKDDFIYYFWKDLVNLQLKDSIAARWMINTCKSWVNRLNIDGYRFDAAWGFNARAPGFAKQMTSELKTLKPSLLLVAEDKGSTRKPYELGFTAAYDWSSDTGWVSQWSWEYDYSPDNSLTVFNHPLVNERKRLLEKALFDGDNSGLRLRFMENNDQHRFIANHSPAVTKMVAEMMFTLPGIPLIYNGQEVGNKDFPYESGPIFRRDHSIASINESWFAFYSQLTRLRLDHAAFTGPAMTQIPVTAAPGVLAYIRQSDRENIIVIVNLAPASAKATLHLDQDLLPAGSKGLVFTDLITKDQINGYSMAAGTVTVPVNGFTTSILLVSEGLTVPPEKGYQVSPNPTSGRFYVRYTAVEASFTHYTLFNSRGMRIWSQTKQVTAGTVNLVFGIYAPSRGLYLLKIDDGKSEHVIKILRN